MEGEGKKTIFGIDLGTTYSCIARVDEYGQPVVLPSAEGQVTTASVVYFESETGVVAGDTAKDSIPLAPKQVASMFKQCMGDEHWTFQAFGKEYRPQELSKFVLQKLAADAQVATGVKVEEVVITCPAYFGIEQKEATRQAGELAGLKVRAIIPEPTAAAIAYGARAACEGTVLVYDLGGGTFDVTLIDIRKESLTVLTTGGDARLGGGLWDAELARFMAGKISQAVGQSEDAVTGDAEFYAQLRLDAEKVKRALTSREKVKQVESFAGERVTLEISREEFDQVTQTLLERTVTLTRDTLENAAKAGHPKPDRICLVGGSSFMPQVKRRLEQEFAGVPMELEDPNQIVAKGAAIFGFITMVQDSVLNIVQQNTGGKVTELAQASSAEVERAAKEVARKMGLPAPVVSANAARKVTNITSRGFGVVVLDDSGGAEREAVRPLVHVDQPVPASVTETFGTYADNQESVGIRLCETEQRTGAGDGLLDLALCKILATGDLTLDRPYPRGESIQITLGLSEDGTLTVDAVHPASGRSLPLKVKVAGVMSEAEMAESKRKLSGMRLVT